MQALRLRKPHNKGDGPPVFSHEFIIQNHADIISCIVMVVFIGLIPQVGVGLGEGVCGVCDVWCTCTCNVFVDVYQNVRTW